MGLSSAQGSAPKSLLYLKVSALLHDPPHKMWVMHDELDHEREAREFAEHALEGTAIEKYLKSAARSLVLAADSLAASFDRWLLLAGGDSKGFLWYEYLHNIFDPRWSHRLRLHLGTDVSSKAREAAKLVNTYLKAVQKESTGLPEEKLAVTLYNVLYLALEPVWYSLGLFPSLADTRVPTHTVFDHNYAAASMSNVVYGEGVDGYYVVLDYPGVQKFIAGRKAGDLWISSWILSNVIWGTGYSVAENWGLDVILTPIPRLNPYAFKSLVSTVTGDSPYAVSCVSGVVEDLCKLSSGVYGLPIEVLWSQPLVPATMTLLLPRAYAGNSVEVSSKLLEAFRSAWRELYELVRERLCGWKDPLRAFLCEQFNCLEEIVSEPPQGISVAVVDLGMVYRDLEKCVVEGSSEACEGLGLLFSRENLERVIEIAASGRNTEVREKVLRTIPMKLLYHLIVTKGIELARTYGTLVRAVPRPFWYYSAGRLENVGQLSSDHACSLCGDEPSTLRLDKVFRPGGRGFEDDYSAQVWSSIEKTVKRELKESERAEFRKFLRPGEVLGPFCLFKRAAYLALHDIASFLSTDDVALMRVSRVLGEREYGKMLEELVRNLEQRDALLGKCGASEVVKELYTNVERGVKDIGELALECGLTYDEFVSRLESYMREACKDAVRTGAINHRKLVDYAFELLGADKVLRDLVEVGGASAVRKLCDLLIPQTSYAILRSDADNVGKLLSGWSPIGLDSYVNVLVEALRKYGVIKGFETVLVDTEKGYKAGAELSKSIGLEGVVVSPAWHSAVSVSLVLSAVEDYITVSRWDGMLIYSGGDDVLAFVPVHSVIAAARELRESFTGDYFKRVGKVVVSSALATGRSSSMRFANLKDLMSQEIWEAYELLESLPKRVKWVWSGCSSAEHVKKDSIVLSDSRSGAVALLPNSLSYPSSKSYSSYELLLRISLAMASGLLSKNVPEDLESFIGTASKVLSSEGFEAVTKYVLRRNVRLLDEKLKEDLVKLLADAPHGACGCVRDSRGGHVEVRAFPIELYVKALKAVRRYL